MAAAVPRPSSRQLACGAPLRETCEGSLPPTMPAPEPASGRAVAAKNVGRSARPARRNEAVNRDRPDTDTKRPPGSGVWKLSHATKRVAYRPMVCASPSEGIKLDHQGIFFVEGVASSSASTAAAQSSPSPGTFAQGPIKDTSRWRDEGATKARRCPFAQLMITLRSPLFNGQLTVTS
jgi:hypothetical protein